MSHKEKITLGIADDHLMFRKGIRSILLDNDRYRIIAEASNGAELIDNISKLPVPPNVCLLDVHMKVLDGYETLKVLKEKYPLMKFLILTMSDNEFMVIKTLRAGANGYLLKEDDPAVLQRAIDYIVDNDFYYSDLVGHRLLATIKKGESDKGTQISEQEMLFLKYCCTEMSYKEIGSIMNKSVRTIEGYRDALFTKLNVNNRIALMIYSIKSGIGTVN